MRPLYLNPPVCYILAGVKHKEGEYLDLRGRKWWQVGDGKSKGKVVPML
jgi:hypothetical protein